MEKIDCVAMKYLDDVVSLPKPARHHDLISLAHQANKDTRLYEQGFLTTMGRFVDRMEAAEIALNSEQIESLKFPPDLFSEDLW